MRKSEKTVSKLSSAYWAEKVFRIKDSPGFYAQIQHAGERRKIPLVTGDRKAAGAKAATFYSNVLSKGWDAALMELDPERAKERCAATVGDVTGAIKAAGLRPATASSYDRSLRWWAARALDMKARKKDYGPTGSRAYRAKAEALPLDDIRPEFVRGIIARRLSETAGDVMADRAARTTLATYLRCAKAAIQTAENAGVKIPSPKPFDGVETPKGAKAPGYRSTFSATTILRKAKKELGGDDPDAYASICLAIGAGLRRGEILNLKWQHVDAKKRQIDVSAGGSWTPKTTESEASVYVAAGLIAELEPLRTGPDTAVTSPNGVDRAVAWLRSKGIDNNNPLHTLRKEFGSIIAQQSDLFTASKQLRHSSLQVTASYYVENRKKIAPDIGKMLALTPKGKK
ncbi:MAG: tyrosine-type recombinase/integrase [Verrucomicrobiota bacterium]